MLLTCRVSVKLKTTIEHHMNVCEAAYHLHRFAVCLYHCDLILWRPPLPWPWEWKELNPPAHCYTATIMDHVILVWIM